MGAITDSLSLVGRGALAVSESPQHSVSADKIAIFGLQGAFLSWLICTHGRGSLSDSIALTHPAAGVHHALPGRRR